jgi:hypothetical protein
MPAQVEGVLLELRRTRTYRGPRRLVFELGKAGRGSAPVGVGGVSGAAVGRDDRSRRS